MRRARLRSLLVLVLLLTVACHTPPDSVRAIREVDVAVPMRDGVVLRAEVLRPGGPGPFPALVYRTPYGAHDAIDEYTTFNKAVERGYAVVVQDVRGRYRSDGEFRPYEHDGKDGYDTIEWAARQRWSDGNVGTFGLSYPGAVQWLAAVESPPHLKAMVPAMTFSTPQNFFYSWGVWDLSWTYWIWANIAPDTRVRKNLPGPRTDQEARASWAELERGMYETLPLSAREEMREVAPYYFDWLRHPPEDPFWDFAELRGKYGATKAAVLHISGWHDDAYGPEGATTNFVGLVGARGQPVGTELLIGPWVHGVDATARTRSGEREFGADAAIDYDAVVLDWMDRHVKGQTAAETNRLPVRYFVMGANAWKTAESWPPPARSAAHILTPAAPGRPGTLVAETVLVSERHGGTVPFTNVTGTVPSRFVSDPDAPVRNLFDSAGGHDYRALADRPDVLTFDSAPLERETEVTGHLRAELFVSCDCRDTDIWARVLDVAPDGTAYNLMSPGLDVLRASYRDMEKGRQLLQPGEIYALTLDKLVTSNLFERGHRIRLQISATFFPNFSRNLHTGALETTSDRRQKATIQIHHDPAHQSRVVLPIVRGGNTKDTK
jgi:putative CocE/NonD family hydrolase